MKVGPQNYRGEMGFLQQIQLVQIKNLELSVQFLNKINATIVLRNWKEIQYEASLFITNNTKIKLTTRIWSGNPKEKGKRDFSIHFRVVLQINNSSACILSLKTQPGVSRLIVETIYNDQMILQAPKPRPNDDSKSFRLLTHLDSRNYAPAPSNWSRVNGKYPCFCQLGIIKRYHL